MNPSVWNDILRALLIMSLSGGVIALLLFLLKPLLKNRLPKSVQYALWLVALAALLVPFSAFVILPDQVTEALPVPAAPIYSIVRPYEFVGGETAGQPASVQREKPDAPAPNDTVFQFIGKWYWTLWPLGTAILLGINVTGYIRFSRKLRNSQRPANDSERDLLAALSKSVRPPRLVRNSLVPAPMLAGVLRPTILLPDKDYTEAQLKYIFLHELTHQRRRDVLVKWLSVLAGAVHWFNPVVYFTRREIERLCELSCDEAVIRRLDQMGKQDYGNTLIAVISEEAPPKAVLFPAMSPNKKALKERLRSIMEHRKAPRKTLLFSAVLLVATVCTSVLLGSAAIKTSDASSAAPSPAPSTSPSASETPSDGMLSYLYDDSDFGVKFRITYPESWTLVEQKAWKGDATREGSPDSGIQLQLPGGTEYLTIAAMLYTTFDLDPERYTIEAFATDGGLSGLKYAELSGSHATVFYVFDVNSGETGPYYFASVSMPADRYDALRDDIDAVVRSLVLYPDAQIRPEVYQNAALEIGLVFPPEYTGKYTIIQHEGAGFAVVHTATNELLRDKYPDTVMGTLFEIERWHISYGEETIRNLTASAIPLFQTGENFFFLRRPTGVEYDQSTPEPWQTTEYKSLCSDEMIDRIIADAYLTNPDTSEPPSDANVLPAQMQITVAREGMEEIMTGNLAVSSRFGYAVYVLPGFTFFERDGCDTVAFDSPLPITLQLYSVNPSDPIQSDHEFDGIRYDYKRVNVGDKTIQLVFCYPPEAIEGGLVLLSAMANTIQPVGVTGGSPSAYQTKEDFLNSAEGELFQAVARKAAYALLSADANELSLYLENPSKAAYHTRGLYNVVDQLAIMNFLFSFENIQFDTNIFASYQYALEGEDSYSYVSMELVWIDGDWKVRSIAIEK